MAAALSEPLHGGFPTVISASVIARELPDARPAGLLLDQGRVA